MKRAMIVAALLVAGFALVPTAAADENQEEIVIDANPFGQDDTTTCVVDVQSTDVGADVETPPVEEDVFVPRVEHTIESQEVFVYGLIVEIGDERHEVGGFWVETPAKTIGAGPVNETVGPFQVSEEVSKTAPGALVCIVHPS